MKRTNQLIKARYALSLTLILLTTFLTSCTWISIEPVNITIKLNPATIPTKDFTNTIRNPNSWDCGIIEVTGIRDQITFDKNDQSEDGTITRSISVPVGSVIDINVEIYQEDVLVAYGNTEESITVASGNNSADIVLAYSKAVMLDLDGGEIEDRIPGTFPYEGGQILYVRSDSNIKDLLTRDNNPQKDGYSFIGWFFDSNFSSQWDFTDLSINDDITLFAKWEDDNPVTNVNIISITANGLLQMETTTKLTLTLSQDIDGLAVNDIALSGGVTIESLTRVEERTYELVVSGITQSGDITISISKEGYVFEPAEQTVYVFAATHGTGNITISYWSDENKNIVFSDNELTISKAGANNFFTVNVDNAWTVLQWTMDGFHLNIGENLQTITIHAVEYDVGDYELNVIVIKDDVHYSGTIKFKITN